MSLFSKQRLTYTVSDRSQTFKLTRRSRPAGGGSYVLPGVLMLPAFRLGRLSAHERKDAPQEVVAAASAAAGAALASSIGAVLLDGKFK
jgi:hypothetical protein